MEVKDVMWFTPMNLRGDIIGIVKTTEDKFYIGIAHGVDEKKDIEYIKETGAKVHPEIIKRFFKEV